jgi:hypothetical protein
VHWSLSPMPNPYRDSPPSKMEQARDQWHTWLRRYPLESLHTVVDLLNLVNEARHAAAAAAEDGGVRLFWNACYEQVHERVIQRTTTLQMR